MQAIVLIVDDDTSQLHMKELAVQQKLHCQTRAVRAREVAAQLSDNSQLPPDLMLIDLDALKSNGLEQLKLSLQR